MAFDRAADGSLTPLPSQNIDTGAGLERLAWVLQGVGSVYETDQLRAILASAEAAAGIAYDPDGAPAQARALRAITEHARAAAFLIHDGVLPGNEGRGYVLRRVLRRAIYFGYTIGLREPFIEGVIDAAISASMGAHAGLEEQRAFILRVAADEERRFQAALARGIELLEGVMEREAETGGDASRRIPGRDMFTLYDTHGLPPELTRELASASGYAVDEEGFEAEMAAQRARSRGETAFSDFGGDEAERFAALGLDSAFLGYDALEAQSAVAALFAGGERVERLEAGAEGEVVLDATAFYAESGGQVGDRGEIITAGGRFRVDDTQPLGGVHVHRGEVVEGALVGGEPAEARVDAVWRAGSRRNHTATHLLHAALREVLGPHVRQAGSLVAPDHLRFDYTHPQAPSAAELREAQRLVNARNPRRHRAGDVHPPLRGGDRSWRDRVLRGPLRRRSPHGRVLRGARRLRRRCVRPPAHGRLLQPRAVRRYAPALHRRRRQLRDQRRLLDRRRPAPHRGADRTRGGALHRGAPGPSGRPLAALQGASRPRSRGASTPSRSSSPRSAAAPARNRRAAPPGSRRRWRTRPSSSTACRSSWPRSRPTPPRRCAAWPIGCASAWTAPSSPSAP